MINLTINNTRINYQGNPERSLLQFLRNDLEITSAKDGCSGQGACGACLVEIDGKPRLSCVTPMSNLDGTVVFTLDGIPSAVRDAIAAWFVEEGAVQCGFCTPGFVMRTHLLLRETPNPTVAQIRQALKSHLCRCTGYKKIERAISQAADSFHGNSRPPAMNRVGAVGQSMHKYKALEAATGKRRFVNDLFFEGMVHGALRFADHPRAAVLAVHTSAARSADGVFRVFTAADIPGNRFTGLIFNDWPLMIAQGETTRYIGDVVALVIAQTAEQARAAADSIVVDYEIHDPVTDPFEAMKPDSVRVHPDKANLLETCRLTRGDVDRELTEAAFIAEGDYQTQRIEHAFLEPEACVALPEDDGLHVYSGGQGIYEDRRQIASLLGIDEQLVRVTLVPNGGGFGGKEDLTVQGHAALAAWLLRRPVKMALSRPESIRMHPKRHPVFLKMKLACNAQGMLTAMWLEAVGDTGAYASVGTKVMERIAGHATGGYFVPAIQLLAHTVYTNNIPSGAMRGFGANQAAFALEGCIDELCRKGGFDRWKFRWDNALVDGLPTATGDHVKGSGIRACLKAVEQAFRGASFAGLACGIKNSGIGNGMVDSSEVVVEIKEQGRVLLHQGWTEMGQGVHTIAAQIFMQETGISASKVEVITDTASGITTGMTTSSRATVLLGNAIKEACRDLRNDLKNSNLNSLAGRCYRAKWQCDWTVKPDQNNPDGPTHYGYGYAAQVAVLDADGTLKKIVAAHDAGRIINPVLFEGQIEGAVHMGAGYALTENLPLVNGHLASDRLRDCGVLRAHQTPDIEVLGVEVPDSVGPYGAKGVGEIGLVPTAAAIANAYTAFDGQRRFVLPLKPVK
ncbi:MAG: selenium-dependent xanthine dehydrogenase [Bacteroidales bacterium]|nr:selenium-dependent xanthine dehydrogenase [Bacteroidales bacterium]MDD3665553.1 selenium-dependent xanthine dehydrogenase [Bacteroidales bacterium]